MICQRSCHDRRICEQQIPTRPEHSRPLGENPSPVGKVVDRINADDGIKRTVLEGQRFLSIIHLKRSQFGQTEAGGLLLTCSDCIRMKIEPDNGSSRLCGHSQRRPSRSAGNVQ